MTASLPPIWKNGWQTDRDMSSKLQQRAVNTKRKILDAAIEKFAASGFAGTTVEDISVAAGVNKQRIYAYFNSKQGLFEAALLEVFQQIGMCSFEAVKRAADQPEKLSFIMLEEFFRVHQEHPELHRLLAWANLQENESVHILAGVRSKENALLREIFENAVKEKLIINVKFENWLFTLLALSCFYYSNLRTMQHTHDPAMGDAAWKNALISDAVRMFLP